MTNPAVPVRVSYSIVTSQPSVFLGEKVRLRIRIQYASGKVQNSHERFETEADLNRFMSRYYPDLAGKCTGSEVITP
jgi:hypothetical protein